MSNDELSNLLKDQKRRRKGKGVPMPQSYLDAIKAKREAARKISGRDRIRARFVQGGSPGSKG
jgi:hypothetical protein